MDLMLSDVKSEDYYYVTFFVDLIYAIEKLFP